MQSVTEEFRFDFRAIGVHGLLCHAGITVASSGFQARFAILATRISCCNGLQRVYWQRIKDQGNA